MNLGTKIKKIKDTFELSSEELSTILTVPLKTVKGWEENEVLPNDNELDLISNSFSITKDNLKNHKKKLTSLTMKIKLDKKKYKNNFSAYPEILKKYSNANWKIYSLVKFPRLGFFKSIIDLFSQSNYYLTSEMNDFTPYYLLTQNDTKLLLHIEEYTLIIKELPTNTDTSKFFVDKLRFKNVGEFKVKGK